jgi:hypothetical protein
MLVLVEPGLGLQIIRANILGRSIASETERSVIVGALDAGAADEAMPRISRPNLFLECPLDTSQW